MSNTDRALDYASDIFSMGAHLKDNILELPEEDQKFYDWALHNHLHHILQKLDINQTQLEELCGVYAEYQERLVNEYDVCDNYPEIAKAMFRYYLQAYRAEFKK